MQTATLGFMELFLQNNNHQAVKKIEWIENRKSKKNTKKYREKTVENLYESLRVVVRVWVYVGGCVCGCVLLLRMDACFMRLSQATNAALS